MHSIGAGRPCFPAYGGGSHITCNHIMFMLENTLKRNPCSDLHKSLNCRGLTSLLFPLSSSVQPALHPHALLPALRYLEKALTLLMKQFQPFSRNFHQQQLAGNFPVTRSESEIFHKPKLGVVPLQSHHGRPGFGGGSPGLLGQRKKGSKSRGKCWKGEEKTGMKRKWME